MIKKVVITNPKGETLELELANPEKSGMAVINIEGLGPPKANINGQEMASADGMFYSSARAETRDVTFTLALWSRDRNSQYGALSIEEARHLTYRYFPLKKQITITTYTDSQILYTKGYVESNEPNIFSQQEQVIISVICPDPFMYEIGDDKTVFSGTQPIFEFPFTDDAVIQTTQHRISPYYLETYGVNFPDGKTTNIAFAFRETSRLQYGPIDNTTTTKEVVDDMATTARNFRVIMTLDSSTGAILFTNSTTGEVLDIPQYIVNEDESLTEIYYTDLGDETIAVRENYLLNSDFRHPINTLGRTEYKHDGATQYLINDWLFMGPTRALDMRLFVRENCIELVTTADNFNDSVGWDRRIWQHLRSERLSSTNIGKGANLTISVVYESTMNVQINLEWANHMNPTNESITYTLPAVDHPTLWTATFNDYPDEYLRDICVGRFVNVPNGTTQSMKIYAMKLEVGDGQTLVVPSEEDGPAGPFHYLADERNDKKLLEFGKIWLDTTAVLDYKGTVDTGILITIHAFGDCENIHLYNVDTREEIFIDTNKIKTITGKPFQDKDDIIISTVRGGRYCRLLRNGEYTNIIGALGKATDWFQISNGSNAFGFTADSGAENISVTFSYQNAYVGV